MVVMYHSNQYYAGSECAHCGEIVNHARWCMTQNENTQYAYRIIAFPTELTDNDDIFLKYNRIDWRLLDVRAIEKS